MSFSKKNLRLAMDLRQLNNSAFAELLGCSVSKVKLLLDENKDISSQDIEKICQVLNLPQSFFIDDELEAVVEDEIFYRSGARIKASYKRQNQSNTKSAKKINQYFMKRLDLPKFNLSLLELGSNLYEVNKNTSIDDDMINSHEILNLVYDLRSKWGLGVQPINNIVALCELQGIRVFQLPTEIHEVDALSFFDEENGCPIIFLNTFKSAERVRFDCAHELGHIMMHIYYKEIKKNRNYKSLEKEANLFASEFLMPEEAFRASCSRYLSLENMMGIKKIWRTSLKAVAYKAHKLGLISEWSYRTISSQINILGYHINEPEETHRDESVMLPKIMQLLTSQPNFSKEQMFEELGFYEDDFNALTFDVLKKVEHAKKPKLYFVD
ncbi:XRE family transcriptional regulator [Moraxella sp. ZY210820]|uniref:XRE family transcriptional regulator n=1 Tax=unclassified Moraxella TaxID=2685852 RepID=UPI00272F933E|nr:XRE family transcriptional regulator [Moraxella sp. ZY210820]WLF83494.1 XRE family transcriptional regulator [Moraxella sp. ZY210820]